MMHKELSVLGVVLSLACAELTGISPGGLIVTGFFYACICAHRSGLGLHLLWRCFRPH